MTKTQQGRNRGASGLTYGLLLGLIAIAALGSTVRVGSEVNRLFGGVGSAISRQQVSVPTAPAPTPGSLFAFTSHTFTPCGASGIDGPAESACRTSYAGAAFLSATGAFSVSNGIQSFTLPATGTYRIEAAGAKGGDVPGYSTQRGGLGARLSATYSLTQGTILQIVVGQEGSDELDTGHGGGGGGGGSFVYTGAIGGSGLLIAAGGGSGQAEDNQGNGEDAGLDEAAACGTAAGQGGAGGGSGRGAGGAGWLGNGGDGGDGASGGGRWRGGPTNNGSPNKTDNPGGFGGGGAGNGNESGGGGGYAGGCGSGDNGVGRGGGSSYASGTSRVNGAGHNGMGFVTVTRQ